MTKVNMVGDFSALRSIALKNIRTKLFHITCLNITSFSSDTSKWVPISNKMKAATRKPGIVAYKGRIYVVGGMGKEKDLNHVQIFNPVTEEWEDNQKQSLKGSKTTQPQESDECVYVPPLEELCGKIASTHYYIKITLYLLRI